MIIGSCVTTTCNLIHSRSNEDNVCSKLHTHTLDGCDIELSYQYSIIKPVKRFQMNDQMFMYRDVYSSIQAYKAKQSRRNTGKQGAQTRRLLIGTSCCFTASLPSVHHNCMDTANFETNLSLLTKNWKKNCLVVRHAVEATMYPGCLGRCADRSAPW